MAEENNTPRGNLSPSRATARGFAPLPKVEPFSETPEAIAKQGGKDSRPRGIPGVRVNPDVAREFAEEVNTKVTTGRSRMRWFANHLMLFVAAIVSAVTLHMTIYTEVDIAYFQIGLVGWVGILALHARYAMGPILKRSDKESQLKAIIPETDQDAENGQ
ncbi:MAG: hypothetical protein HN719_04215 [Alphaproteobacteria bacterium]|nr:hypothetical protein [Alphaproteobacteria bacterium]